MTFRDRRSVPVIFLRKKFPNRQPMLSPAFSVLWNRPDRRQSTGVADARTERNRLTTGKDRWRRASAATGQAAIRPSTRLPSAPRGSQNIVRILRFVTGHRPFGGLQVGGGERHARGEIFRLGDDKGRLSSCRIHGAEAFDGQRGVKESFRHAGCPGPSQLRHDAADESMVGMAVSTIRSPRDHGIRTKPPHFSCRRCVNRKRRDGSS